MTRSRTCCCCIPIRTGVLVLSIFTIVEGLFISSNAWSQSAKHYNNPPIARTAEVISGLCWTSLSIVSGIGFVGTLNRSGFLVGIYASFLWVHVWFSLLISAFYISTLFIDDRLFRKCIVDYASHNETACRKALTFLTAVCFLCLIFGLAIQCCASVIASRYKKQLELEENNRGLKYTRIKTES